MQQTGAEFISENLVWLESAHNPFGPLRYWELCKKTSTEPCDPPLPPSTGIPGFEWFFTIGSLIVVRTWFRRRDVN